MQTESSINKQIQTKYKNKKPRSDKGTKRNSAAAMLLDGTKLGNISHEDMRWTTGEIISVNKGRKFSEIHIRNMKANHKDYRGESNPFYGKSHSLESKIKIGSRYYRNDVQKTLDVFP